MHAGERAKVLTRHNYGGGKKLRAVEANMNQLLTYNIWGRRGRAVIMSDDAKGCYDRIAHVVLDLALRRLGTPTPAIQSMITTIQEMTHHVQTAFGRSSNTYGGTLVNGSLPPQGVLQGNGAGPAGWFAISTAMISAMKSLSCGYSQWSLIAQRAIETVCFAFVDDTDLIHHESAFLALYCTALLKPVDVTLKTHFIYNSSTICLANPARPPIGLNPERFVACV